MTCSKILTALLVLLVISACEDKTVTSSALTDDLTQAHTSFGIQQLQARLLDNPHDFETLSRLADLYFESGQYLSAIQVYDRALAVNPECADCLNDKGLAQFYLGDTESALTSLGQANRVDPAYPNAWLTKGFILLSVGRDQEAIEPLQQVQALDATGVLAAEAAKFLASIEDRQSQE